MAQIPMVAEAEYMISARLPMPVLDDYGDPIGASLLDMTWHSWGDILVGDGFYFTNPIPNSNAGISAGGGNSSGGETDNAKKLARALNATGVQSLGNPCSIASLYLISATSGLVLSPEVYAYAAGAVSTYWPGALQFGQNFVRNWTNRPTFLLWPLLKLGAKYGNQALAGIQQGCNALQ